MSPFAELPRLEAWRRRVEAAGYRAVTEPWSPAPPTRPPVVRVDVIGDASARGGVAVVHHAATCPWRRARELTTQGGT